MKNLSSGGHELPQLSAKSRYTHCWVIFWFTIPAGVLRINNDADSSEINRVFIVVYWGY